MRKLFLLISFLLPGLVVFGQLDLGIKANIGISKISRKSILNISGSDFKVSFAPSGQTGFFCTFQTGVNTIIGTELLINQIESTQRINFNWTEGYSLSEYSTHLTYLSLPLYYGFKFKNFTLNAGFQGSLCMDSSERYNSNVMQGGEEFSYDSIEKNLGLDKFDFGTRLGFMLLITDKIAIEAIYYHGINSIVKSDSFSKMKARIQQATIGVRYSLR